MIFLDNLINGLSLGSIYAIIALGYTMVYGIAKMLNFAHGDIIMVGAYIAFCALQYWGLSPIPALLAAMVVCTVLGVTIEALAYRPLRKVAGLAVLITAIGMSYLLQNVALMIWGANPKSFPRTFINSSILHIGGLNISSATIYTILTNVVIMAALTLFTAKTKMGKAMRCVSEDRGAAELMGINVNRTISLTFAIGSALAAIAGVQIVMVYIDGPYNFFKRTKLMVGTPFHLDPPTEGMTAEYIKAQTEKLHDSMVELQGEFLKRISK